MITEVVKLIADKGPMLCAAYSRLTRHNFEPNNKLTIRYMTPEEEMRYLISTHNDKRISTDSI
jgi:hypothetical protein